MVTEERDRMNTPPKLRCREHHLSVRQGLWNTYIVCQECGKEYETAWNKLINRLDMLLFLPLYFLLFECILPIRLHAALRTSDCPEWLLQALWMGGGVLFYFALHILLNLLQAFLLRRSDDLASHIF